MAENQTNLEQMRITNWLGFGFLFIIVKNVGEIVNKMWIDWGFSHGKIMDQPSSKPW